MLAALLLLQGCFTEPFPLADRETRVIEALSRKDSLAPPASPLTATDAIEYALRHNLDARVAELEWAYQNESTVAAKRRLLPTLDARYSLEHNNHPGARWSKSIDSGRESLESSYSSNPDSRRGDIGLIWNVIDFGVGYFKARQQGEKTRQSQEQYRRARQQIALDVLSNYWRASAAVVIASEAEALRADLEAQAESVRDSVAMRILAGPEGARRELSVYNSLTELEQWQRGAMQARLELARVLGCSDATTITLAPFSDALPEPPAGDPALLQEAALRRRPELYQQDALERIAVDEARLTLLQMAPNANLSLMFYDDRDMFLEWNNWMTVGARVSWNLFSIPTRMAERRMAKLQEETAKKKGMAIAAAVMAQVGIAYSELALGRGYAEKLLARAAARQRLVEALAAGERDGQTRPGEVLYERVRLLADRAAALRALAEVRVAEARLANAIGLDIDDYGQFQWALGHENSHGHQPEGEDAYRIADAERRDHEVSGSVPEDLAGLRVVMADEFLAGDDYFRAPDAAANSGIHELLPEELESGKDPKGSSSEEPRTENDREEETPSEDQPMPPSQISALPESAQPELPAYDRGRELIAEMLAGGTVAENAPRVVMPDELSADLIANVSPPDRQPLFVPTLQPDAFNLDDQPLLTDFGGASVGEGLAKAENVYTYGTAPDTGMPAPRRHQEKIPNLVPHTRSLSPTDKSGRNPNDGFLSGGPLPAASHGVAPRNHGPANVPVLMPGELAHNDVPGLGVDEFGPGDAMPALVPPTP